MICIKHKDSSNYKFDKYDETDNQFVCKYCVNEEIVKDIKKRRSKMSESRLISTGDIVHHNPTGEQWVVAFNEDGRLSPFGWPETLAKTEDCILVEKATDEKRIELEQRLLEMPSGDIRGSWARRNIKKVLL